MYPMPTRMSEVFERCSVLRRQEEGVYTCYDYLSPHGEVKQDKIAPTSSQGKASPTVAIASILCVDHSDREVINEVWREKTCEWNYQVIDHFEYNREIAFISLNYLDRYLSAHTVIEKDFELVALTSLYIAVKVHESITPTISSFVAMSSGRFNTEDLESMEYSILCTLSWYVHPPTPLSFVRNYMVLLDESGCSSVVIDEINETARFLTELSVCDYYFTTRKPSLIGLGTVLTAFKSFDEAFLPTHVRRIFQELVRSIANIDICSDEMIKYMSRLSEYRIPPI